MIYILHGSDKNSSYDRLQNLLASLKDHQKIRLNKEDSENLINYLFSTDMFADQKVVVMENFITKKLFNLKLLKNLPKETSLIFWEEQEVPVSKLKNIEGASIENFKLPPTLFYFLDTLGDEPRRSLALLKKISNEKGLIWHVANRLLLLVLAKMDMTIEDTIKITGRAQAPWQWQKIKDQSRNTSLDILRKLFSATIKIDMLIKSGKTSIAEDTLIELAILKYVKK